MDSKYYVRLYGDNYDVLEVTLADVLVAMGSGHEYKWLVSELDGLAKGEDKKFVTKFKKMVKTGGEYELSFDELKDFSEKVFQIYDGYFFGYKNESDLDGDVVNYEAENVLIHFVQSTFCDIYTNDLELLKRVLEKFELFDILETEYLSKKGFGDLKGIKHTEHDHPSEIPEPFEHFYFQIEEGGLRYKGKAQPVIE